MKKTTLSKLMLIMTALLFALTAFSCGRDKTGKSEFKNKMLSDFTAEIDYLIDLDENPILGTAVITKGEKLRIDIESPDPYSGISVECDAAGEADVISISYSGIKADVPRNAMEKVVFLMNMMSERTACELDNKSGKDFIMCPEQYVSEALPMAVPYEVSLSYEDTEYMFIYDSVTGAPLEIFADNGYCRAEIKVRKMTVKQSDSEE